MTDTPEQQVPTPVQQVDWEARYKGSVHKIEELTLANRNLTEQLAAATSEREQLRVQLSSKDVEKDVALNQSGKILGEKETALNNAMAELKSLRALKTKLDAIKKTQRGDLLEVIDAIPSVEDPVAMDTIVKTFADFATSVEKRREQQLMAGVVPTSGATTQTTPLPTNEADWMTYINKFPMGSPEKAKAMNLMWDWGMSQNK